MTQGADVEPLLDRVEERVLGSLIEKAFTTPDYYPLTLNSLTTACNQKSNRHPVVEFDEKTVVRALDVLRDKELVRMLSGAELRVPKYYHRFGEALGYSEPEMAVLCELMLRGPQTVGELRGRASRMSELADLAQVESILTALSARETGAVVTQLPRRPGHKERRYAHLLAGEPEVAQEDESVAEVTPEPATLEVRAENDRIGALEKTVEALQQRLDEIQQQFDEFR